VQRQAGGVAEDVVDAPALGLGVAAFVVDESEGDEGVVAGGVDAVTAGSSGARARRCSIASIMSKLS